MAQNGRAGILATLLLAGSGEQVSLSYTFGGWRARSRKARMAMQQPTTDTHEGAKP